MSKKGRDVLPKPALFAAAFLVAIGGLIYELILGTAASYLFGDSIVSFSLAAGLTLFGMGIGSLISSRINKRSSQAFAWNEIALGLVGGTSVLLLFAAFSLTKLYWVVFIILSLVIGALIGLEIPLMLKLFRSRGTKTLHHLLSRILALDYFGALIASLLFPFLLLPYLGLARTALAVGILNISIALYILRKIGVSLRATVFSIGTIALLIGLFLYSTKLEAAIDSAAYRDPVIYSKISSYQKIVLTKFRDDTRLYLNNQLQFSSIDEARYHETLTHSAMSSAPQPKRVAILGGGDGLLAREVLKYDTVTSIDLIDLDPAVTDLAQTNPTLRQLNHDSLRDPRVTIIHADAFTHIRASTAMYDVILADLVDPSSERIAKLYSKEFYRDALRRLTPSGVFITQATSTYFTPNAFATVLATLESADSSRSVIPLGINVPSFGEWGFALTLPSGTEPFTKNKLSNDLSYMSQDSLQRAIINSSSSSATPSSLLHPTIYRTYNRDMQQWSY